MLQWPHTLVQEWDGRDDHGIRWSKSASWSHPMLHVSLRTSVELSTRPAYSQKPPAGAFKGINLDVLELSCLGRDNSWKAIWGSNRMDGIQIMASYTTEFILYSSSLIPLYHQWTTFLVFLFFPPFLALKDCHEQVYDKLKLFFPPQRSCGSI